MGRTEKKSAEARSGRHRSAGGTVEASGLDFRVQPLRASAGLGFSFFFLFLRALLGFRV